jgi:hydrogenase maturation protease
MRDPFPDTPHQRRLTVIGLGSPYRGDDAAGLTVAGLLTAADHGSEEGDQAAVQVVTYGGEPTGLLTVWEGLDQVWIVDAAVFDAPAGTIRRLVVRADTPGRRTGPGAEPTLAPLAGLRTTSTHALGLIDILDLAGMLGTMPPRIVIYAIRGADFSLGATLSPPVAAASRRAAALIRADVARVARRRPGGPVADREASPGGEGHGAHPSSPP